VAKTVGEVLRQIREDADLSRSAVARKAGMEPGALLRVEQGRAPTFELVYRVAKALGISMDDVAAAAFGRGARPAAEPGAAQMAEGLRRLDDVLLEGAQIISSLRSGQSVSPPRRKRKR
jgi:transcriptional regulator with XRE-family HTH domain